MNASAARVVVLVPALNERAAIRGVVQSALRQLPELILVDDGSSDGTAEVVADLPGVTVLRHDTPQGKGEALRAGFRYALARDYDAVLTMDGDGQHAAADIPRLLAAAARYPRHIIVGARLINRECQPAIRRWANNFADWGIGWACGQRLVDTQSGQRYYPREVLELADTGTGGFVFESEILIEAAWRLGMRVVEVPIESRYHGEFRASHFRSLPDFWRITRYVVGRIVRAGLLWKNYRRSRREAPLIFDPPSQVRDG